VLVHSVRNKLQCRQLAKGPDCRSGKASSNLVMGATWKIYGGAAAPSAIRTAPA
jgi:hypothetical protein